MIRTYNIFSRFFIFTGIIWISFSCAQQGGGMLVGGEKDVTPPEIMESTPENFSINFTGQDFEFVFNEYFALKELNKKLIISPPMEEKPEIKVKGKKLQIHFITELQPDLTYTLNFGDALVDLNESNPLDNFAVVFSTGNEIDSLELTGTVIDAFTGEPVEGVAVMLYSMPMTEDGSPNAEEADSANTQNETPGTQPDSLPLKQLPLYLSRTNKEGQYHLKNLAGGEYKLFALLDGNNNYLFDQASEKVAFIDSLVKGIPPVKIPEKVAPDSTDNIFQDSTNNQQQITNNIFQDSTINQQPITNNLLQDSTNNQQPITDSLKPKTLKPLRLFTEIPAKQYITSTERKQADKIFFTFNESLDSLSLDLLYAEDIDNGYLLEWSKTRDSISCWLTDSLLSNRDSLIFAAGYYGYDSIEQREWIVDTLKFKFRSSAARQDEKNPMSLRSNTGRTLELGLPLTLSTGLPFEFYDTSKIALFRVRDSLEFREELKLSRLSPTVSIPGIDAGLTAYTKATINKAFLQDSSYSLRILPGAFTGFFGHTNDSLTIDFKVNNIEKYGSLIMNVENLSEPAVLQLLNSKKEPVEERKISKDGLEKFTLLKPGKYWFKIILDKNQNGKWDTGRYLKNIQPEVILFYGKEITLKANWEMEETWTLNPNPPN